MDKHIAFPHLVDYSSDEETPASNEDGEQSLNTRSSELPPLPLEIHNMYGELSETEVKDDPAKHGGKIRVFPHERGVWATYVYIEYNPEPEFFYMIEKLKNLSKCHGINFETSESFHVSLSRTVKLRHHWIAPFIDSLRAHLCNFIKFKIMFQSLEVYENEEKTRTFLGLKAHIGYEYLCKMVKKVDSCLTEFKLPTFYENPSFHLSIVSCVGSKGENIELFLADLNAIFDAFIENHTDCRTLWVTEICCKSGNKLFTIPLKS